MKNDASGLKASFDMPLTIENERGLMRRDCQTPKRIGGGTSQCGHIQQDDESVYLILVLAV